MTQFSNGKMKSLVQENTTLAPYRLAKLGTTANTVVAAVDASAPILGVTNEAADNLAGHAVGVCLNGTAKLCILAATSKGAAITGTTAGKGAATTTDNDYCVGYLMEATTVANQIAEVLVNPFMYGTI